MDTQTEETLTFIGNLVTLILTIFLLSFFAMMLWNWIMPQLFKFPIIDFWQALGINTLSHILFRSNFHSSKK